MRKLFLSLRFYNYKLWFFAALVANIGTWMQRVAQDWVVLTELTDNSGFAVGIVAGLQFVPAVLLTPFAGVITDRFNKRKILIISQILLALLAAVLGVVLLLGIAELWHVYLLATILGIVTAFEAPARQVFVSELVEPSYIGNAVSLNAASFNAGRLVGPAAAGVGIALIGSGWVFIANAVSFVATIIATMMMREREMYPPSHRRRSKGALREGLRYTRNRADIKVILAVVFVVASLGFNFPLTSAVMTTEVFDRGPSEYGLLGSMMAIGALSGALMAARRTRPRVRFVVIAAFAYGIFDLISAFMPTFATFAILAVPTGYCALTVLTAANGTIQMGTDPHIRGRVMSLYIMVYFAANPIGAPLIGWVAETYGARESIVVGGAASLIISILAALWTRKHWGVRINYEMRIGKWPHITITSRNDREAEEDPE